LSSWARVMAQAWHMPRQARPASGPCREVPGRPLG
jgi:hypothetical protein